MKVGPFVRVPLLVDVISNQVVPDPGYDDELEASNWITNPFVIIPELCDDGGPFPYASTPSTDDKKGIILNFKQNYFMV